MKLCWACAGKGGRWVGGYCACDGWCHNPGRCKARTYEKCRKCREKGITGKITIPCPTCGAAPNRKCNPKFSSDDMTAKVHILRLLKAADVARQAREIERREESIQKKRDEIAQLEREIEELRSKQR